MFAPGALIDENVGALGNPLRFRFALDVGTPLPFTVHAFSQEDTTQHISDAATQTQPGVWEGTLTDNSPLNGTVNYLGLIVRSQAPALTVSIATAGQSWFELSRVVPARGVPALQRADTAPSVTSYNGSGRTLWFTDHDWTATSFNGDLTASRAFSHTLERPARMLIAWVQTFDSPFTYSLLSGQSPDARRLENSPRLEVSPPGGAPVAGTNSGVRGRGQDAVAILDVPAGDVLVQVSPSSWDPDDGGQELAYKVHVVAVHGERTLRSMRWRFGTSYSFRTPNVAACPYGLEPVPVPRTVGSFAVDVDWQTYAQPSPHWTVSFDLPTVGSMPCGEVTAGDRVRFTLPRSHSVWFLGPAPARDSLYVSNDDTVFEMQVDYTYREPAS
jgi:hypothetical protein